MPVLTLAAAGFRGDSSRGLGTFGHPGRWNSLWNHRDELCHL